MGPLLEVRTGVRNKTATHSALREIVFGVNDGLISITGLVVGVAASHMTAHQVLLSGLAATTAAVVAMGLGAFLSTAAQNQYVLAERDRTAEAVQLQPQVKQAEVARHYHRQGLATDLVDQMTRHTIADRQRWVAFLVQAETGVSLHHLDSPWTAALLMAGAVWVGSWAPIVPFLIATRVAQALPWSIGLALTCAGALGIVKARVTAGPLWRSGLQFALVAAIAVAVGTLAGRGLHAL